MELVVGIVGASLLLFAFIMEQANVWKNDMLVYDLVNFTGAAMLVIYGIAIEGWPFVVLNSIWAMVSFKDVVIDLRRKNYAHLR